MLFPFPKFPYIGLGSCRGVSHKEKRLVGMVFAMITEKARLTWEIEVFAFIDDALTRSFGLCVSTSDRH